jgi:hypothetical protein
MGILDSLRHYLSPAGDALLEPLLASQGLDLATVDYDPDSRHVVLALKIHGRTKVISIPTKRVYTRAEICAALASHLGSSPIVAAEQAQPPPTS